MKIKITILFSFVLLYDYLACNKNVRKKTRGEITISIDSLQLNHYENKRDYCQRPHASFYLTLYNNGVSDFRYENKNELLSHCDYSSNNSWIMVKYIFLDFKDYQYKQDSQNICVDKIGSIILKPKEKISLKSEFGISLRGDDFNLIKDELYKDFLLLKGVQFYFNDIIIKKNTNLNFKTIKYKVIYKIDDSVVGSIIVNNWRGHYQSGANISEE